RPVVCGRRLDWIAELQAKEVAAVLRRGKQVGGRKSEAGKAECVGGVRLLCRNDAAAGPLVAPVRTREHDGADVSIAIDDGRPHVESQTAILLFLRRDEGVLQVRVAGQIGAVRPRITGRGSLRE